MEPITLAVVTSAVTLLGSKVAEGLASEVGKSIWKSVKGVFGWHNDPPVDQIARQVAEYLIANPVKANQVLQLLKQDTGPVGMLVGQINAEKVVVAHTIEHLEM